MAENKLVSEGVAERIKYLKERKELFKQGGGQREIQKQHERGKLTARERLDLLFDKGTFTEYDLLAIQMVKDFGFDEVEIPGDACISGHGLVNGRKIWCYAQDFTSSGGSWGGINVRKFLRTYKRALEMRLPIVLMMDSGGRRPHEQHSDENIGEQFFAYVNASGVIPQIGLIMGPVAGGPCYGPALTDFIFMVKKTSYMFIGGPPVVKAMTGEEVTTEELGGAEMHASVSGVADLAVENDEECIKRCKELLSFLPDSNLQNPPIVETGDDPNRVDEGLNSILPESPKQPYDMRQIINRIVDNSYFFEIKPNFAKNVIVGFARLNGHTIGINASQPLFMGGILDVDASDKSSRFVRFCDAMNIPILNLIDSPAFITSTKTERQGLIRHGAKMLFSQCETTVPKVSLVVRKGLAGSYIAMGSRGVGADILFSWPSGQFGTYGVDAAFSVLLRTSILKNRLAKAENPKALEQEWRKRFYDEYIDVFAVAPFRHVDDIIEPKETRPAIIKAFEILSTKKKERPWRKHGNIPL
ncbi:MAG: acyl-CoA carboxylase subunit beta [Thermodesulfobacteriota bacterium]|nr:acyl-CoA carboxylase subunit beta [Thermodesulfobacteriota bacterium]